MHEGLFSLSLVSQVQDADGAQDLQLTAGQVEFDRVSFSYVPGCVANMLGPLRLSVCVLFFVFCFYPEPLAALTGPGGVLLI